MVVVLVMVVVVVTVVAVVVTVVTVVVTVVTVVATVVVCSSGVVGDAVSSVVDPTSSGISLDLGVVAPSALAADVLGSVLVLPRAAELLLVLSAAAKVLEFS